MSKHWRPDETEVPLRPAKARSRARRDWTRAHGYWRDEVRSRPLPPGAKAGLVLLAAACLGVAIGLYQLAGPSDVFERDHAVDWNAVGDAARR